MAFWHGRILPGTVFFRRRGIVVITSENFDGEWIAGIIERFGYGTARGSTSRGGVKALLQLSRDMAAGKPAGFTVDGPRGPARVAQPGALWLAKTTGNPVLPVHFEADRHWTANSWDGTQIPKPFATVALVVGEPFEVPRDAGDDGIEGARRELEARLTGARSPRAGSWRRGRDRRVTIRHSLMTDRTPFPTIAADLLDTVDAAVPKLRALSEPQAARPRAAGKWTPKADHRTPDRLGVQQPPAVRARAGGLRADVPSLCPGALGGLPALRRSSVGRHRDVVARLQPCTSRM